MSGGSLGIRTGSYGSLQQQQQQQQLNGGAALPIIQTSPVTIAVRKPPKMSLPGSREKERILPRICKLAGRRKVGMLLLLVASVAFFISFSLVVNKEDDVSAGPGTDMNISNHLREFVSPELTVPSNQTPFPPVLPKANNVSTESENAASVPVQGGKEVHQIVPALTPTIVLEHHPCENFSLAPPPPNEPRRPGPRPCPVCYAPVELAVALMPASPSVSPVIQQLSYVSQENLIANISQENLIANISQDNLIANGSIGGSMFGGYPSLEQRSESFDIKESMTVHCGFVKGKKPGKGTGFDIDDADLLEMEQCHGVVVASAIFGNYDVMQQPKNISEYAKKNACFFMFVDEETESYIRNTTIMDSTKRVGLWRVVVVQNLPYTDARRNGKVPKLLLHRLFPNARFSLWIDGKLELVVDPYQLLERFLWRENATFAISKHYKRFDVFVEAEANKAAGKYDNVSIDHQIEFYKNEGLTPYSSIKLPITSDVPEGCVIMKEHTPITNLFTCLWFNEVDLFTARDQLSFSTVRDKMMSKVNWTINMFLDCERRNFVVQAYHRDLLEQRKALASRYPPPSLPTNESPGKLVADKENVTRVLPSKKPPMRRGRDRKTGSRRRHPKTAGMKDSI